MKLNPGQTSSTFNNEILLCTIIHYIVGESNISLANAVAAKAKQHQGSLWCIWKELASQLFLYSFPFLAWKVGHMPGLWPIFVQRISSVPHKTSGAILISKETKQTLFHGK